MNEDTRGGGAGVTVAEVRVVVATARRSSRAWNVVVFFVFFTLFIF